VDTVKSALEDARLKPEYLELELTESLILESVERTIQTMHELKKMGLGLSLDDFGTGYSSLSYLHHYPVDRIKIDQSFVRNMTEHAGSAALVRSILLMAGNLGLTTIAEGVETVGQYGYLRKQLCQEMQGFLFSRPVSAEDFIQLLRDGRKFETLDDTAQASYTVLLVDDEVNFLSAMRRAFRNESWKLLTASQATEGLELLARHGVGVVISDQRMANMSGTEFLNRVKKMYPDTIRILLTGYADFTTVIDAVNQGDLYKVLSKPIDDVLLREHIREALRRYDVFYENRRLAQRLESLGEPRTPP
jgi:FixJ family two-component response regulator